MDVFSYIDSLANSSPWILYLLVFISPFVQEDTAVIGTAALTAIGKLALGPAAIAIILGLFFSDIWKYWIGWFALKHRKGAEFAQKEVVLTLKNKVEAFPFTTLIAARFIPFTRIPSYIACGFFQMQYSRYCAYIAITTVIFVVLAFGAFHILGSLLGEHLNWLLPVIGIVFVIGVVSFHYIRFKVQRESRSK